MGRAPCCDKANVKKGPWSPEEDAKLKSYITQYGTGGNWIALPQKIGLKRCGKSCRLRWLNYLRPNIKHGGFTEEEENIICSLFISIGSRWSIIAAQLPGRTDNDIKNYWNTRLKKKLMAKQRKEQEIKKEIHDGFFVNQTQSYQQITPYLAENLMPIIHPNHEGLLRSTQYDDQQLKILLTKTTRGHQTYNDHHNHQNLSTEMSYQIINSGNYSNWQNSGDQFGVNGDGFIDQLESYYLRNMMSLEGTESYSSVDVGNSSTTITSPGSTSLLVTTPLSDFDAYQKEMLH